MKEFHFVGCIEIKELLGIKANDEQKLMEFIEEAPADSIYYHTHSYFLRHYYVSGPYPNDFANWAAVQVRDRVLGEKLGAVTPSHSKTIEQIRAELIDVIDEHLSGINIIPFVLYGQPFYFMKSRIIEINTGIKVSGLDEFIQALKIVDASAIYNHIFEARIRDRQGRSDFEIWIEQVLGLKRLAEKIDSIDWYMYTLEGLRDKLIQTCEKEA